MVLPPDAEIEPDMTKEEAMLIVDNYDLFVMWGEEQEREVMREEVEIIEELWENFLKQFKDFWFEAYV